jgi:hypothetical protein
MAFRAGRRVVFQCKRYEKLGPQEAEAVVAEILRLLPEERPAEIVLVATCQVSSQARRRARIKAGSIDVQVWALTELDTLVNRHPELRSQFFALPFTGGQGSPGRFRCLAPRPSSYVARREYQSILEHLLGAAGDRKKGVVGIATTALRGAGGFGKTTIAQALCHDERVQGAYPGGILWVTMGDQLGDSDRLARVQLAIVHHQIWERVHDEGFTPRKALSEVEAILAEEGLVAFDRDDLGARELAVSQTLNASLRRLGGAARERYGQLALFPEDAEIPFQTPDLLTYPP